MSIFEQPTKSDFTRLRKRYGTMEAAFEHFQNLRAKYNNGQAVSTDDSGDLLELLRVHPDWPRKTANGVQGFTIALVERDGATSTAFHLIDDAGRAHSFSYVKCLRNTFGSVEWRNAARRRRRSKAAA